MNESNDSTKGWHRRAFLKSLGAGAAFLASPMDVLGGLAPVDVTNPLDHYPSRGWEKIYRDQYHFDTTFTWICAPNDTHMCRHAGLRPQRRDGAVGAELRPRPRRGPIWQSSDASVEPQGLPEGIHVPTPCVWRAPTERSCPSEGMEGLGRCGVPILVRRPNAADALQI